MPCDAVLKCAVCKEIFSGVTVYGSFPLRAAAIHHDCEFCYHKPFCVYQLGEAEPTQISYRVCPTCMLYLLYRGSP